VSFWDFINAPKDFIINAATGNLSEHQVEVGKAQLSKDIAQAGAGLDPAVIVEKQKQAVGEYENFIRSIDAHPDDASLRLPGLGKVGSAEFLAKLDKLVKGVWIVAILALLFYLFAKVGGIKSVRKAARAVRG